MDLKATVQQQQNRKAVSPAEFDFLKLKVEAYKRQNNLIIEGIKESRAERDNDTYKHVRAFIRDHLGITYTEIDRVYRLGRPRSGSAPPRPILVRFTRLGDRMDVWSARNRLNDADKDGEGEDETDSAHYVLKEDFPAQLRPIMAAFSRVALNARRYPERYGQVHIRDFRLFINGRGFNAEDLESLPDDLRPSSTSTPGNVRVVVFFGRDSRFSNHYPSMFVVEDFSYSSMEQYLAHYRARYAERPDLSDRALASSDPAEAKRVLNLLRGSKGQKDWEIQRKGILFTGLLAKFSQNLDLAQYLLSTADRQLGEASTNKTWGIGLTLAVRERLNSQRWTGENLQGKTLMEVRAHLRNSIHQNPDANPVTQASIGPLPSTETGLADNEGLQKKSEEHLD